MARAGKIVAIVGAVLVVLVIVAVVALKSMDFSVYRGLIAEQVEQATGRRLVIDGDLALDISLHPAIAAEGVAFANAPWGSRPHMARLERVEAQVELLPLLTGDVRVSRVVLMGLDALLETDAQGRGNWEFEAPSGEADPAEPSEPAPETPRTPGPAEDTEVFLPVVREVQLQDVTVTYRDGATGEEMAVAVDSLQFRSQGPESPLHLEAAGTYGGVDYALSGRLGSVRQLAGGDGPFPVSVQGTVLGAAVQVEGAVADPRTADGIDIAANITGEDLGRVVETARALVPDLAGATVPSIGPFDLSARIGGSPERLSVADIIVAAGRSDLIRIEASGTVADVLAPSGVDLAVSVSGDELARVIAAAAPLVPALAGVSVPDTGPFAASLLAQESDGGLGVTDLDVAAGGPDLVEVKISGSVADVLAAARLNLAVSVSGKELARVLGLVAPMAPPLQDLARTDIGPYRFSALVRGSAAKPSLRDVAVEAGRPGKVHVKADGAVGDLLTAKGIDLAFAFEGRELAPFAHLAAMDPATVPPVTVSGRVREKAGTYTVDGLRAKVGATDLVGRVGLFVEGPRPRVEAALNSRLIFVDEFLPKASAKPAEAEAKDPPPPATAAAEKPRTTSTPAPVPAPRPGRVLPADPLPLDLLGLADAKVALRANRVRYKDLGVSRVTVDLDLTDRRLTVKPVTARIGEGQMTAEATLDGRASPPEVTVRANGRRVPWGDILKAMHLTGLIQTTLDTEVELSGRGRSVAAILASLDGTTRVVGREGRLDSTALKAVTAGITDVIPWLNKADANQINCLVSRFDIEDGLAQSRAFLLDTNGVTVEGSGSVNLADETLDLSINAKGKSVSLADLVVPFTVGGTFASPSVRPDLAAAGKGTVKAVKGLIKKPKELLGALGGLLGGEGGTSGAGGEDPCMKALGGGPTAAAPAPAKKAEPAVQTAPPPPQEEEPTVEDVIEDIKGLGKSLKGLFGR